MWWIHKIRPNTKIKKRKKKKTEKKKPKQKTAVCSDSCLCQLPPLFASDLSYEAKEHVIKNV